MITIEESIPSKNYNYRLAEDIFYYQFNDISFYIEDEDQENFFFCVLRNLFPDMKIEKIFPLNGKDNVIKESTNNLGDRNKVFIVDKDFDDILKRILPNDNLFYLERYSIENFLVEDNALIEYIISEKPKLKREEILQQFHLSSIIEIIKNVLNELVHLHLIVQSKCPRLKNVSLNHERFFDFNNGSFQLKQNQIIGYRHQIVNELKTIDRRLNLDAQYRKLKKEIKIDTSELCLKHIPGKYIIKMIKQVIESLFGLVSRNTESFCYRIAEKCSFISLIPLKNNIENYIR